MINCIIFIIRQEETHNFLEENKTLLLHFEKKKNTAFGVIDNESEGNALNRLIVVNVD